MNIYLISRKVHRYLTLVTACSGLIMMITGLILKYPHLFDFLNFSLAQYLHNQMSIIFGILLLGMAISGLIMYFLPIIKANSQKDKQDNI
ncbi:MAG: hypothetical protein WC465_02280 [Patescibacteria group bacterium]